MMKTVLELCKPRESVFLDTTRDDVLNLSDFVENKINPDKFFNENFKYFSTYKKCWNYGKALTGCVKQDL